VTEDATSTAINKVFDFTFPKGDQGDTGDAGTAATLSIGTVTTKNAGTSVEVTNTGTDTAAVLDIGIPRGADGEDGESVSISVGTVTTGTPGSSVSVSVSPSSTTTNKILDFTIPSGDDGTDGTTPAINIGTVTTTDAGTTATITEDATSTATSKVFNFSFPKGDQGTSGTAGTAATLSIGTVTTKDAGTSVEVTNTGSNTAAVLDIGIPRGPAGNDGTSATVTVGSVETTVAGTAATITEDATSTATSRVLNFSIPKGDTGDVGQAASVSVGTTTTGAAGSSSSVVEDVSSTASNKVFNFTIPRGDTGSDGSAATIAIGSVTTGNAGGTATVTNSGNSQNASLDFVIPRGATGTAGSSDWESKLFIDDTPLSSGFLPYQATVVFRHFYPGHSDGYDRGSVQNAPSTTSTSLTYYTKESLLDAFFNAVDSAIGYVTRDAVYIDGNGNYIYEITKTFQTGYIHANTRIEIGSPAIGDGTTNTKLRQLLGLGDLSPSNFSSVSYYPTNIGTNKWRFTFPINIVGEGAEDAIFDVAGTAFKYGTTKTLRLSNRNPTTFFGGVHINGDGDIYRRYWHPQLGTFNGAGIHLTASSVMPMGSAGGSYPSNTINLGNNGSRWNALYYNNGVLGSDDRLKHNEEEVVDALGTIKKLKLLKYDKTTEILDADFNGELGDVPHRKEMGFIAQSVNEIPELAFLVSVPGDPEEEIEPGLKRGVETYGLDYQGINSLLVQAVQELSARVEALENA
jgi:hypothetical protein